MNKLDDFFASQEEPAKTCLDALRLIILNIDKEFVTEKWYYRLPCFFYKGQIFCYLFVDKKKQLPYIAMYPGKRLNHTSLEDAGKTQSKILFVDPNEDIDIKLINDVFAEALSWFD